MSLFQPIRTRHLYLFFATLLVVLTSLAGLTTPTAAQSRAPEWELFDLPERVDLLLGALPDSEEAVAILPVEGTSTILLDSTPFDRVTLDSLDPVAWEALPSVELWPGDTVVLRSAGGAVWKICLLPPPPPFNLVDNRSASLHYALLSDPQSNNPTLQQSIIRYYDALDLSSGNIFSDESVASVMFCDSSVVEPTPTPSVVPEPGSGGLLLLGLFGVLFSWRLARRRLMESTSQVASISGHSEMTQVEATERQVDSTRRWWLPLLLLSLCTLVQGVDVDGLLAQYQSCLLMIEREGGGSGRVTGEGIDCGESCAIAPLSGGAGGGFPGSGEVYHVKAIADTGSRFLEWRVNGEPCDGLYRMSGDTILTAVFDAKHPPLAVNDRYHTDEDVALQVPAPGFLENDSDPDGDAIEGELAKLPLHGDLTFNADGSCVYIPDADFHGIDQFLYRLSDGELDSAIAAVTIEVLPQSDPPVAEDLSVETVMNTPLEIALQGHDPDGDRLLYRIVDLPANGTLSGADNSVVYTPNADFTGQDTFSYLVNDGANDSDTATVTMSVLKPVRRPVADAGPDRDVYVGTLVTVDGGWSSDPENRPLTYHWELSHTPDDSRAALSSDSGQTSTFEADVPGQYRLSLVVNNGMLDSEGDSLTITAIPSLQAHDDLCMVEADSQNSVCDVLSNDKSFALDVPPLKNMLMWVKADALEGASDGQRIAVWTDQTYHRHHASQSSSYRQPLFSSGAHANGLPSLSFDGPSLSHLWLPPKMARENFTLFLIARTDETHLDPAKSYAMLGNYIYHPTGQGIGTGSCLSLGTNGIAVLEHDFYYLPTIARYDGNVGHGFNIISYHLSDNRPSIFLNGDKKVTGRRSGRSVHSPVNIGGNYPQNGFSGQISEVMLYHGVLSQDTFTQANQYLGWKYGISVKDEQFRILSVTDITNGGGQIHTDGGQVYFSPPTGYVGVYTFNYTLTNGQGDIETATVTVNVHDTSVERPVADAGTEQRLFVNDTVRLDGSASFDSNGYEPLEYYWTFIETPARSQAEISDTHVMDPSFYADVSGDYYVQLVVRNSDGAMSAPVTVHIAVSERVTVPNVIGLVYERHPDDPNVIANDVERVLYEKQLYIGQKTFVPSERPRGEVLEQFPVAGNIVFENTPVDVMLSQGSVLEVSLTAPADGTEAPLDGSLTIEAEASDDDGEIVKVEFYAQNITFGSSEKTLFDEDNTAPYSVPWTIVEPGIHAVIARATDDSGAWTDSAPIHIIVQNGQPEIISEPSYSAPIGELYQYDVDATDLNNDPLTYSLEYGPDGMMIDAESGLIAWTPAGSQNGQQTYRVIVEDGRGAGAGQTVDCFVPEPDNTPPEIVSEPIFTARVGEEYIYDVDATDTDGDPLSFRFMKAPEGMSLNPQSGIVTWTPTESQIGAHTVSVVADDGYHGIGGQTYTLTVRPANQPPTVSISAPGEGREVEEGETLTIRAEAADGDDGVARIEFVIDAQAGVQSSDCRGANSSAMTCELDWSAAGLGEHTVSAIATDNAGASTASEPVSFIVTESFGDFLRPEISLTISSTVVSPGDTITLWLNASDNKEIASTSVTVNGEEIPLNPDGSASYTVGDEAEILTVEASATDAEGNTGYASEEVRVLVPGDTSNPLAEISSPEILTTIYTPTEIHGSASAPSTGSGTGSGLLRYTLEYSPKDRDAWTSVGSGSESVTDGVLGTLDPSLMQNGLYDIRLTVEDASGNLSMAETVYQVAGNMKIGLFTISFNDLTIPVSGIPITVTRTYDSRDKLPGDFGTGWTLSTSDIRLEESASPGGEWEQIAEGGGGIMNSFITYRLNETTPHKVTVTYPGGSTDEFRMVVTPRQSFPYKVEYVDVTFEAESGTFSTLEALGSGSGLAVVGNVNGPVQLADPDSWDEYNPNRYKLTRMDGTVIVLNQDSGIESITEPNGNVLTFTEDGILHSKGKSVQFVRNDEGFISEIIDPMGASVSYEYDSYGDLVKVTDQEGYDTRFTYEGNHYLKDIIDPRGVRATRNEYDEDGRLVATIDPDGHRIEFEHDPSTGSGQCLDGCTEVIRDRLGYPTVISYDDRGNVLQETDAEGHTKKYSYDEWDRKISETDPLGQTTAYSYDEQGNLTGSTNPLGHSESKSYNSRGQVLTMTDFDGNLTQRQYDGTGNLTQVSDPGGALLQFVYDTSGRVENLTDQIGKVYHLTYDTQGNVSTMVDPDGNVVSFTHDENGNVISSSSTSGTDTLTKVHSYDRLGRLAQLTDEGGHVSTIEYNAIGKRSATVDTLGHRTEYVYDALGNLDRVSYPDGTEESFSYDAEGRSLSSVNRAGQSTSFDYDTLGRLISTQTADGASTSIEYDAAGQVLSRTDARGNRTRYSYDAAGRNTAVTNALGQSTSYAYSPGGKLLSTIDANGHETRYSYDANGRRTKTTFADGGSVTSVYDEAGRVISEIDRAGQTTQFDYDWRGKLTKVIDALGHETVYAYDEAGNLIAQSDPSTGSGQAGHTTRFAYDKLGRMTTRMLPLGQEETLAYDAGGNLVERRDFNGDSSSFDYDTRGRVINKQLADGQTIAVSYAPDGSQKTINDSRGSSSEVYDVMGRLQSRSDAQNGTISYEYDLAGNLTGVTTPSGTISASYDALNRLETLSDPQTGTTRYRYDPVGNLAEVSYPNGTKTEYTYDALNRLVELTHTGADGTTIASYAYTLDANGNRTRVEEFDGRTVDYAYDAAGKVLQETISSLDGDTSLTSYTYDAVGNRLTKTENGVTTNYHYDANNRLLQEGQISYRYDDNGNLTEKQGPEEDVLYRYNAENRLTRVETTKYGVTIAVDYEYDADGNRTRKVIDGNVIINYLVDTNRPYAQVVEERDADGNLLVRYVYGHDLISQTRPSTGSGTTTHYYHYDGLGSTRALSSSAGIVTDEYTYDAFGNLLDKSGNTSNEYLYTGEFFDSNIGFYYLRARYMSPQVGRFVTMDTFAGRNRDPYSLHKYLYAHANPVNLIDPSGESPLLEAVGTGAMIGFMVGVGIGNYAYNVTHSDSEWSFGGATIWALKGGVGGALIGTGVGALWGWHQLAQLAALEAAAAREVVYQLVNRAEGETILRTGQLLSKTDFFTFGRARQLVQGGQVVIQTSIPLEIYTTYLHDGVVTIPAEVASTMNYTLPFIAFPF